MYKDEGIETDTSRDLIASEAVIKNRKDVILDKDAHIEYILRQIKKPLPSYLSTISPWVYAWTAYSLFVLMGRKNFYSEIESGRLSFLNDLVEEVLSLQASGFCGNKEKLPNLGNTYAALTFLQIMKKIHMVRKKDVISFIQEMHWSEGFKMHRDGETDMRTMYCAIASFSLLYSENISKHEQFNPLTSEIGKYLFSNAQNLINAAQTYEGGFAAAPGEEAHGGYTYCALASLCILQKDTPNKEALTTWLSERQGKYTLGFNGRTNKCTDSCYNFWVGSCFYFLGNSDFSLENLKIYTFSNCQSPLGGIQSAPTAKPDIYHTCYALLGIYLHESDDFNPALGTIITKVI